MGKAKLKNANRNENIRGFDLNFNIYGSDKNFIFSLGRSAYSRTPRGYHGRFEFLELNEIPSFTHGIIYYPKDKKIKNEDFASLDSLIKQYNQNT